ncbi:MAG: hypothetical protein AB1611_17050 [bacterium]
MQDRPCLQWFKEGTGLGGRICRHGHTCTEKEIIIMAHIFFERLENRQSTQALYGGED